MSDKAEKKPDAAAGHGDKGGDAKDGAKKGGGLMSKTPVLLGAVMLIEAVVLFAGFKFLGGGPKPAAAAETAEAEGHDDGHGGGGGGHGEGAKKPGDKKKYVELQVVEFRGTNKVSGRTLLFDVSIFATVNGDKAEAAKTAITDRAALIKDRVRTIIAQSDPEKLSGGSEPGLETLRRQVKYQLDEIVGEGMVEDVLVPRCIPFRAEF